MQRLLTAAGGTLAMLMAGVVLTGRAEAQAPSLTGSIRIDGSSTVYPITEAVAEAFRRDVSSAVRVTVGVSGTGGGFKRFVIGETEISNASRPIKDSELAEAKRNGVEFIEIPVAYDGLSIVVHKSNSWCDSLTVEDLRKIFLAGPGAAKRWSDVRRGWPDTEIRIFAPGTDSGTFDYFKEVVAGKDGSIRSDMSVSEDDNILVRGVAGNEGSIGFFGCAYYFENKDKLRAVAIDGGKGPIEPTPVTIESGTYAPFSRPLFIYVNKDAAYRPEVASFVEFYIKQAGTISGKAGYVRLPREIYQRGMRRLKGSETGSAYHGPSGEAVHGPLSEVYK